MHFPPCCCRQILQEATVFLILLKIAIKLLVTVNDCNKLLLTTRYKTGCDFVIAINFILSLLMTTANY